MLHKNKRSSSRPQRQKNNNAGKALSVLPRRLMVAVMRVPGRACRSRSPAGAQPRPPLRLRRWGRHSIGTAGTMGRAELLSQHLPWPPVSSQGPGSIMPPATEPSPSPPALSAAQGAQGVRLRGHLLGRRAAVEAAPSLETSDNLPSTCSIRNNPTPGLPPPFT